MKNQNEGLRGTCNARQAGGLRSALSQLRIRALGHATDEHLSSNKCVRHKTSGCKECSRPLGRRTPRQAADLYHSIYVQRLLPCYLRVCPLI